MKNIILYILLFLMIASIVSIVLGYYQFGFGVGFLFAALAMTVGSFYSMKNREYTHKSWHNDFRDRHKK